MEWLELVRCYAILAHFSCEDHFLAIKCIGKFFVNMFERSSPNTILEWNFSLKELEAEAPKH